MAGSFIQLDIPPRDPKNSPEWFAKLWQRLGGGRNNILYVPSFTVTTLPSVNEPAGIIYVSNEVGGAVLAFSDGTNWRRVTDRAIVS